MCWPAQPAGESGIETAKPSAANPALPSRVRVVQAPCVAVTTESPGAASAKVAGASRPPPARGNADRRASTPPGPLSSSATAPPFGIGAVHRHRRRGSGDRHVGGERARREHRAERLAADRRRDGHVRAGRGDLAAVVGARGHAGRRERPAVRDLRVARGGEVAEMQAPAEAGVVGLERGRRETAP